MSPQQREDATNIRRRGRGTIMRLFLIAAVFFFGMAITNLRLNLSSMAMVFQEQQAQENLSMLPTQNRDFDDRRGGEHRRPRILMTVISYDLSQYQYFERLMDSIHDICSSAASVVDIVIFTTVAWPVSVLEDWGTSVICGSVDIRIKAASWKNRLPNFCRDVIYQELQRYDLFIYTEEDHMIRPRHVVGFLRETRKLRDALGDDPAFADYAIGFLRYEMEENNPADKQKSIKGAGKVIWEHAWNLKSTEAFARRHLVQVPGMMNQTYFNGGGPYHQGMFMATPEQLEAWKDRPPNCQFNTTWFLERPNRREKVSSLHLFSKDGCNVTQIIPVDHYTSFLVHHQPDYQHDTLYKYLPKDSKVNIITSKELGKWLQKSTNNLTRLVSKSVKMYNDETQKKDSMPDLTEYKN